MQALSEYHIAQAAQRRGQLDQYQPCYATILVTPALSRELPAGSLWAAWHGMAWHGTALPKLGSSSNTGLAAWTRARRKSSGGKGRVLFRGGTSNGIKLKVKYVYMLFQFGNLGVYKWCSRGVTFLVFLFRFFFWFTRLGTLQVLCSGDRGVAFFFNVGFFVTERAHWRYRLIVWIYGCGRG